MLSTIEWQHRIQRQVTRWWRRDGYLYSDRAICEDLMQAAWLAVLSGTIREEQWSADLHTVIREAVSLHIRGVARGNTTTPWSTPQVHAHLREKAMPVEEQVRLRLAIRWTWQQLDAREKLVWYGACCVPGPLGPGSDGIPQAWAQQWGLTRVMVHARKRRIQALLRQALSDEPSPHQIHWSNPPAREA